MSRLNKTEEQRKRNREYQRKWFAANREKQRTRVSANTKRAKAAAYKLCDQYKSSGCSQCSEMHLACLDFHHKDSSQKEINICKAIQRGWSLSRLEVEIQKCIILCSNCHRKLHWQERIDR